MFLFLLSFLLTTFYLLYAEMKAYKEVVMVRFEGIHYDVPLSVDYLLGLKEDEREQIVHISAVNCKAYIASLSPILSSQSMSPLTEANAELKSINKKILIARK